MIAILGGFGAAVSWALSTLCSSRSSRIIDPASVVAWVALTGLVAIAPFVIAAGVPSRLDWGAAGWLALAGAGNVGGLLVAYLAYRSGVVALIAPLIASEGAIAALIAIAAGETVSAGTLAALAVIAVGVSLAAARTLEGSGAKRLSPAHEPRLLAFAGLAAVAFGVSLYATGRVSSTLPLAWVVLPTRLIGTVAVAMPLLARGRLRLARPAAPLVATAGLCEVLGIASYTLGARHDIAVAAVVGCQFAALAAVGGIVLFGERLGRVQVFGVLVLLAGVTLLSAIRG